jgi:O-antigen/teichoic acid export membrane protein
MSVLKKNIKANFVGKGWQAAMSIVFVPFYISFLGIDSYGLIGIFASMMAVFGILDMGLSTTMNREVARLSLFTEKIDEMRNLVRTFELIYWCLAFIIGFIVIGSSGLIADYWIKSENLTPLVVEQAFLIMGLVVAFRWPVSLYSGGLMGLQKQVLLNGINIFIDTTRGVGALLVLWLISPTIQAFLIWQVLISLIHVIMTGYYLWRNLPKGSKPARFKKQSLIKIWRFTSGMTGISLASVILVQSDKIILSKILSLEMFGYYSLASVVVNTLYFFIGPVFNAVFPRFTQLISSSNDQNKLIDLYHKSSQLMSVMIIPATVVVSLFSSEIMFLWIGDPITVSITNQIISILIIGTCINGLMNLPYALQIASSWTKLSLGVTTIACIVQVPLVYFLATYYGMLGAAIAWVILNVFSGLITIQIMHSRLLKKEKFRWFFNDIFIPLITALIISISWRLLIPTDISKIYLIFYLFGVSSTSLLGASLVTPVTRKWLLDQYKLIINK